MFSILSEVRTPADTKPQVQLDITQEKIASQQGSTKYASHQITTMSDRLIIVCRRHFHRHGLGKSPPALTQTSLLCANMTTASCRVGPPPAKRGRPPKTLGKRKARVDLMSEEEIFKNVELSQCKNFWQNHKRQGIEGRFEDIMTNRINEAVTVALLSSNKLIHARSAFFAPHMLITNSLTFYTARVVNGLHDTAKRVSLCFVMKISSCPQTHHQRFPIGYVL